MGRSIMRPYDDHMDLTVGAHKRRSFKKKGASDHWITIDSMTW
jgi:hypothetical protein